MTYEQILAAVLDRANGAKSKYGEFKSLEDAGNKMIEEHEELMDEIDKLINPSEKDPNSLYGKWVPKTLSDMEKFELHERIFQESLDCCVVSLRLAFLAKSMIKVNK